MAENTTYMVNACQGALGKACPNALMVEAAWIERLGRVVEDSGWPEFLVRVHRAAGLPQPKKHNCFRIAVSACPNGCSRPHIADLGLIRACTPVLNPASCTCCGVCRDICPDKAIGIKGDVPVVDRALCKRCGQCCTACPSSSLVSEYEGWRVLVGGHLGRHPRLGKELPGTCSGTYSESEVESLLTRILRLYMRHYDGRRRFGVVLEEKGGASALCGGG